MKKKKITFYCDMDGVLADFFKEKNAVENFKSEEGFFSKLQPIQRNVDAIKGLILNGYKIKILSTSPHEKADQDKKKWLSVYLPEVKENDMIFCRPNNKKIDCVAKNKRSLSVLIDDYGKNTREWVENGGRFSIKISDKEKNEPKTFYLKDLLEFEKVVLF